MRMQNHGNLAQFAAFSPDPIRYQLIMPGVLVKDLCVVFQEQLYGITKAFNDEASRESYLHLNQPWSRAIVLLHF